MSEAAGSRIVLIANPAAGRGRAATLLPDVRAELATRGVRDIRVTSRAGEEVELARRAAAEGAGTIVALGGDGTWGNVAHGILTSGRAPRLALLAAGTGNDLAFASGVPAHDVRAALQLAVGDRERRIDVGHVSHGHANDGHASHGHTSHGHTSHGHTSHGHTSHGHTSHGHTSDGRATDERLTDGHLTNGRAEGAVARAGLAGGVHFVNCCGFGFDAEVVRTTASVRWLRGHAVYVGATLRQLFAFRGLNAHLRLDELRSDDARVGEPGVGDNPVRDPNTFESPVGKGRAGYGRTRDRDAEVAADVAQLREGRPSVARGRDESPYLMLVVCNGPRFGGGFHVAPGAAIDDGALDLVTVRDAPGVRRLALLASLLRGVHLTEREVTSSRVSSFDVEFDAPPVFEADGELHRATSTRLTIRCLPAALRLAAP